MISMEAINLLTPKHERTSCSDEKTNGNEYFNEMGYPRCSRCLLLHLKEYGELPHGAEMESVVFQLDPKTSKDAL